MSKEKLQNKLQEEIEKQEKLKNKLQKVKRKILKLRTAIKNEDSNKLRHVIEENNYTYEEAVRVLEGNRKNEERKEII